MRDLLDGRSSTVTGETPWTARDYFCAIEASGFPGIFGQPARLRRAQLDTYLRRVVDRDLLRQVAVWPRRQA